MLFRSSEKQLNPIIKIKYFKIPVNKDRERERNSYQIRSEAVMQPGDLGPMGWVPRSIPLKGLRLLPQPHQTSQPLSVIPYVSITCGSRYGQSKWHHSL